MNLARPCRRFHVAVLDERRIGVDIEAVLLDETGQIDDVILERSEPARAVISEVPAIGSGDRLDRHSVAQLVWRKNLADHLDPGFLFVSWRKVVDHCIGFGAWMKSPPYRDVLRRCGSGKRHQRCCREPVSWLQDAEFHGFLLCCDMGRVVAPTSSISSVAFPTADQKDGDALLGA